MSFRIKTGDVLFLIFGACMTWGVCAIVPSSQPAPTAAEPEVNVTPNYAVPVSMTLPADTTESTASVRTAADYRASQSVGN